MVRARWFRVPAAMAKSFPKGQRGRAGGRGPDRRRRDARDGPAVGRHGGAGGSRRRRARPAAALRHRAGGQGARARADAGRGAGSPRRWPAEPMTTTASIWSRRRRAGGSRFRRWRRRSPGCTRPADEDAARLGGARAGAAAAGVRGRLRRPARVSLAARGRGAGRRHRGGAAWRRRRGRALETALAFALTATQARALDEIAADLAAPRPMRRLLVGDVGSGKTAVAFGAAALVAAAGAGTLMMVPTEVLAEQQAARARRRSARALGIGIAALTGATPAAARARDPARLGAGDGSSSCIGTQALLGLAGELPRLGLVVVDEQHRFGVAQRGALGLVRRPAGGAAPAVDVGDADSAQPGAGAARRSRRFVPDRAARAGGRRRRRSSATGTTSARAAYARLRDALADGNAGVRGLSGAAGGAASGRGDGHRRARASPPRAGAGAGRPPARRARRGGEGGGVAGVRRRSDRRAGGDHRGRAGDRRPERDGDDRRGGGPPGAGAAAPAARAGGARARAGDLLPVRLRGAAAEGAPGRARLALLARIDDGFRLAEANLAQRGFGNLWGTAQAGEGERRRRRSARRGWRSWRR